MTRSPVWLLLVAVVSAACDVRVDEGGIRGVRVAEGRAENVWTRTYTLPADGTLEIVGGNGTIDVGAGSGPEVEVRAEREARADTEEARASCCRTCRFAKRSLRTASRLPPPEARIPGRHRVSAVVPRPASNTRAHHRRDPRWRPEGVRCHGERWHPHPRPCGERVG